MKHVLVSISIFTLMALQGCSVIAPGPAKSGAAKDKPAKSVSQAKKNQSMVKKQSSPQAGKTPAIKSLADEASESLDPDVLYKLMAAEIAGQRGQLDVAVSNYLAAAQKSNDATIAERATRIAVYARDDASSLKAARIWVALEPENLEVHQVLAALLVRTGNSNEAQTHLEKLVEAGDSKNNSFMLISSLLSKEKDKQRALRAMQQLVTRYKEDPQALYAFSHLAFVVGSFQLAEDNIKPVVKQNPGWSEAQILLANILNRQEKYQELVERLERAVEDNPRDQSIRLYLARKYIDLKKYQKAAEHFQVLVEQQPDHADALYALGIINLQLKNLSEAESYLLRLLELGQRENDARYYLGQIAEANHNSKDAERWYRAVEEGNYYLEANIRIANLVAARGNIIAAREHLQNTPADTAQMELQLYLAEGDILRGAKMWQEAAQLYSDALEQLPDNTQLLYARALTVEKLDNIHQTILDLERIIELAPNDLQALNALGYTLVDQTERINEGVEMIRRAYALNPTDPAIIDSMGWAYYRVGNYDEALALLKKAFAQLKDPEIAAHLGEVLWVTGDEEQARQIWEEALREKPDSKTLRNVIERFSE